MYTASNSGNEGEAIEPDRDCDDRQDRASDDVGTISMDREGRQLDHTTIISRPSFPGRRSSKRI